MVVVGLVCSAGAAVLLFAQAKFGTNKKERKTDRRTEFKFVTLCVVVS